MVSVNPIQSVLSKMGTKGRLHKLKIIFPAGLAIIISLGSFFLFLGFGKMLIIYANSPIHYQSPSDDEIKAEIGPPSSHTILKMKRNLLEIL